MSDSTTLELVFDDTVLEVPSPESTVIEATVLVLGSGGGGGGISQNDLNTAVAGEATLRTAADTTEAAARVAGDSAEATARNSAISSAVSAHAAATDPHGDRAYTDTQVGSEATARAAADTAETSARGSAITSAIGAHVAATDPHGDRAYTDTVASGKVGTVDSRLTDARTPTAHAASHASAGSDAVTLAQSQITGLSSALSAKQDASALGTAATKNVPASGNAATGEVVLGSDTRLGSGADKLGLTPTAVKTANYTASAGDFVPVSALSGAVTVTLPNAPADGSVVCVKLVVAGIFQAGFACAGSDVLDVAGGSTSENLDWVGQSALLQYKASSHIWYRINDDIPYATAVLIFAPRQPSKGYWSVGNGSSMTGLVPGADGLFLAADSSQAAGLKYRSVGFLRKTGVTEYFAPENGSPSSTVTLTNQRLYFLPLSLNQNYTIDRLACSVTTAQAATVARIGIYNSTSGRPDTLVVEPGSTADVSTTGDKELTLSQALTPALYWLGLVVQGSSGVVVRATAPTYNATTGSTTLSDHTSAANTVVWIQGSVSGALPSTATPTPQALANSPRVIVRVT